jgi:hypothetical protein
MRKGHTPHLLVGCMRMFHVVPSPSGCIVQWQMDLFQWVWLCSMGCWLLSHRWSARQLANDIPIHLPPLDPHTLCNPLPMILADVSAIWWRRPGVAPGDARHEQVGL